jgi:hypothetical protein
MPSTLINFKLINDQTFKSTSLVLLFNIFHQNNCNLTLIKLMNNVRNGLTKLTYSKLTSFQMISRLSGLQFEVLKLYRQLLRAAVLKSKSSAESPRACPLYQLGE